MSKSSGNNKSMKQNGRLRLTILPYYGEKKLNYSHKNRGSVLAMICIVVVVLSLTGLSLLKLALAARLRSAKLSAEIAAQNAADTGLTMAVEYVYALWNANAPDLIDINYESSVTSLPGTNSLAEYHYTVILCEDEPGYDLASYGAAGVINKEVHLRMLIRHPWVGIAVKRTININVGAGIGLEPEDYPNFNLVTNLILSGSIVLRNGVRIPGDVIVGPGGDPDVVIDTKREAVIEGEAWPAFEEVLYPDVTLPPSMHYASLHTDATDPGALVMDTSGIYGSISLGSAQKLKVVGDIVAIMQGTLTANNGATIQITENSSLRLYMAGNIDLKYGSVFANDNFPINGTYEQIRDATKSVKIYGTNVCTSISLKNSSFMAAAIYAPYATILLYNSADFYGAVMANNVDLKNSGNFIFVYDLYDDRDNSISNLATQRGSWWEN